MKSSLQIGTRGVLATQVGPGQTITLGGDRRATVFSTPSMINLMELAAREALRPHLNPGEESVGVDVQVTHSSATPPKTQVTAEATVTGIEKNVISFAVTAQDPWGEIGRGTHRRAVIDTQKFADRLTTNKVVGGSRAEGKLPKTKFIDCQQLGQVLRLTLNRPQKRNAMSAEMTSEFEQLAAYLEINAENVRVVIVGGAGDTFCAGDDVGVLPQNAQAAGELSLRRGSLYQQITELPQVFIATVDGLALGGGLVLAAACDFRIATPRAKLGLPEVQLGWPPNYGMGILQSVIGRSQTLDLALRGDTVDGRQAKMMGLVNQVVVPAQLAPEAQRMAEHFCALPAMALAAAKRLLSPAASWSDAAATQEFIKCQDSDAARQSIARFRKA